MPRIVVLVKGGTVTSVYGDAHANIEVIDCDIESESASAMGLNAYIKQQVDGLEELL